MTLLRFWLIATWDRAILLEDAYKLYKEIITTPFKAEFQAYAKSSEQQEAQSNNFSAEEAKPKRTLEEEVVESEISGSKQVEVLNLNKAKKFQ